MKNQIANTKTLIMIGAGASSLSFLNNFLNRLDEKEPIEIFVVDKNTDYGRGNAYKDDVTSNLLNTKAGYITIDSDKKSDFYHWLSENNDWRDEFPNLEVTENSYLPRALFGCYMQDKFNQVVKKFVEKNVRIVQLKGEVINIKKLHNYNYNVELECGLTLKGNIVVLATGTNTLSKNFCDMSTQILNNPYPLKNLVKKIDKQSSVLIVGARLSAIDTVIALKESGHEGNVTIHSRSGTFPSVRGTQNRYKNIYLNKEYIDSNNIQINKENLLELFYKELDNFKKVHHDLSANDEYFDFQSCVVESLEHYLEKEIAMAANPRAWQAILYDTNSMLSYIWNNLAELERQEFMEKYSSFAMALRVSIPIENAKKILSYLQEDKLMFTTGTCTVLPSEDSVICNLNGIEENFDYVVYAIGSPRDLTQSDSNLFVNLDKSAITTKNKFGGIEVCPRTFNVLQDTGETHQGLYALGEITNGTHLFNSALDIIVSHSKICCNNVADSIKNI